MWIPVEAALALDLQRESKMLRHFEHVVNGKTVRDNLYFICTVRHW